MLTQEIAQNNIDIEDPKYWRVYKSYVYYVDAPEGPMEIAILEDAKKENGPVGIIGHCGKSGTIVMSWVDAFCRVVSMQLEKGYLSVDELREQLSNTTSSGLKIDQITKVPCRSGAEAIYIALTKYKNDKYEELRDTLEHSSRVNGNNDRRRLASRRRDD